MKSYRQFTAIAAMFALAGAGLASAQEKIYITGSTAYRGQAMEAINFILGGSENLSGSSTLGSGVTFASAAIPPNATANNTTSSTYIQGYAAKPTTFTYYGGKINGTPVTIKCSFTGSVGGLLQISSGSTQNYLPDADTGNSGTSTAQPISQPFGSTGSQYNALNYADPTTGGTADAEVPTITFADTFQSTTGFVGTVGGTNYTDLSSQDAQSIVAANPFQWVVSFSGNPSNVYTGTPPNQTLTYGSGPITNITDKIVYALYGTAGDVYTSMFTGTTSNTVYSLNSSNVVVSTSGVNPPVLATGRDFDSGTRITALADAGILSELGNTVVQYNAVVPGSVTSANPYGIPILMDNGEISEAAFTAPLDLNGVHSPQADGGYHNGPDLAITLANASASSAKIDTTKKSKNKDVDGNPEPFGGTAVTVASPILVGYVSTGDAGIATSTLRTYPGYALNYNGVPYSPATMQNGEYSFWGYEHIYNTVPSTDTPATTLVSDLLTDVSSSTIAGSNYLTLLQVSRASDGAPIEPNSTPF